MATPYAKELLEPEPESGYGEVEDVNANVYDDVGKKSEEPPVSTYEDVSLKPGNKSNTALALYDYQAGV